MCSGCPKKLRFEKKAFDVKECGCKLEYPLMIEELYDWYLWYDSGVRAALGKNLYSIDHLIAHMKKRKKQDDENRQLYLFKDFHLLIKKAFREKKRTLFFPNILILGKKSEPIMYEKFDESSMCDYISDISFAREGDLHDIEENSFHVIILNSWLHHLSAPEEALKHVNRILKPQGVLIVKEHDCKTWKDVYVLDLLHYILSEVRGDKEDTVEYRSKAAWRELICSNGFSVHENLSRDDRALGIYYDVFTLNTKLPVASLRERQDGEKETSSHKP